VLGWVVDENRAANNARILGVARKTVGNHVEHLRAKLHAENHALRANLCPRLRLPARRQRET
jgi:DNA-binding CsgD family transcriptional regulator